MSLTREVRNERRRHRRRVARHWNLLQEAARSHECRELVRILDRFGRLRDRLTDFYESHDDACQCPLCRCCRVVPVTRELWTELSGLIMMLRAAESFVANVLPEAY